MIYLTNIWSTIPFRYESIFDGSPSGHTLPKWRTRRLAFAGWPTRCDARYLT
jgi:hypothetical protein